MAAFTAPWCEQNYQDWLRMRGFSEDPFAPGRWNTAALHALLLHRLAYCSQGQISRWEDLCKPGTGEDSLRQVLAAAQGSPERLLLLCDVLLRSIAAQGKNAVTAADIAAVLAKCQPPTGITPLTPPTSGLFMDAESGHVWIDSQQLLPPLTEQEYGLLHILYAHAPEIVSCEALIRSIWPEDRSVIGDEQNLRKLISRLRRRLEPRVNDNQWRFIRSIRGRGYWLNRDIEDT